MPRIDHEPGILFNRQFNEYFRTHEEKRWRIGEINFGLASKDKLVVPQVKALRGAMLVESHNPVYSSVLFDMTRRDLELAAFTATWTYEEVKHYMVLMQYLKDSGYVDSKELEAEMDQTRAGPWGEEERNFSRIKSFTYTTLQEQITGQFYQRFGDNLDEAPLLQHILRLVAKDEYRHCQYYLMKARQELDQDGTKIREVDEALLNFGLPGPSFIARYNEYGDSMAEVIGGRKGNFFNLGFAQSLQEGLNVGRQFFIRLV